MYVYTRTRIEHASVLRRGSFRCVHCKHWQRAEVTGRGRSQVTILRTTEDARERAQLRAARNGDRLLRFATCPKCKRRSGHGAFVGRYALIIIGLAALMFVVGAAWPIFEPTLTPAERHVFRTAVPLFVDGCIALIMVAVAIAEWFGLDRRVRWLYF